MDHSEIWTHLTNLGLSDQLTLDVFLNHNKHERAVWMGIHLSKTVNYAYKKRTNANATVKLV